MGQITPMHQPQTRPPTQPNQPGQQPALSQLMPQTGSLGTRPGGFDTAASPMSPHSPGQQPLGGPPQLSGAYRPVSGAGHERSYSHSALLNQSNTQNQQPHNVRNSTQGASSQSRFDGGLGGSLSPGGPPQLGALPFQTQELRTEPPQQRSELASPLYPGQPESSFSSVPPSNTMAAPTKNKQVFGVSLMRLYERDSLAVPMVVYQCIQAVDLYGLAVEGIYRLSGSQTHVNKLKTLFDTGSSHPSSPFPPFPSPPSSNTTSVTFRSLPHLAGGPRRGQIRSRES